MSQHLPMYGEPSDGVSRPAHTPVPESAHDASVFVHFSGPSMYSLAEPGRLMGAIRG